MLPVSVPQLLEAALALERRYAELEQQLAEQASGGLKDPKTYQALSKELSDIQKVVTTYRTYRRLEREASDAKTLAQASGDADLERMAQEETLLLQKQQEAILKQLKRYWEERHQEPERPLIVEVRAGTGGLEASLFVVDLYRMYTKYAAKCFLDVEPMESQPSDAQGLKEVAFAIRGVGAWQRFKYESGVHRVQRVPETEAQGRIHTSTVTVAVLPEPAAIELPEIPAKDLEIDVYRSSGPGGQGVNTTDSAVRIRHLPTGLIVTCQDERSQLRNKEKAMRVLRARLLDQMQRSQHQQIASSRKQQVGSGDRSEKIRTYNFPDRRVTDHRAGITLYKLDLILEGDMDELIEALMTYEREKNLREG